VIKTSKFCGILGLRNNLYDEIIPIEYPRNDLCNEERSSGEERSRMEIEELMDDERVVKVRKIQGLRV
jgi:hypothetical protein